MTVRNRMVTVLGAAAVFAGCGGDGGGAKTGAKPSAPPEAKEPPAAAAARLERALPRRDCKALAPLMLHSARRGSEPTTPPTAAECRFVRNEARHELRGFKVRKVQEFGPAGVTEGTGDVPRSGEVVGVVWVLDRDGSWKAVYDAIFRTQIGFTPAYGRHADANAQSFVNAVAARNCDGFWRLLNVASRFVRGNEGHKGRFCRGLPPVYRDRTTALAQIKADPGATAQELGQTRDIAFYALRLHNGRYMVLVLTGRLGGIADSEQKEHDNPSVLELVTLRRAAE